jgi:DNA-binding transcriptional MerR regulator
MAVAKKSVDVAADAELLSIGALARATGVSQRTIRYYEELGILPPPVRSAGGTRRYPADYKFYVEGALLLKDLGFTLEEVKLVGRLGLGAQLSPPQRKRALSVIDGKMQALEHRMQVLDRLHSLLEQERSQLRDGSGARTSLAELFVTQGQTES